MAAESQTTVWETSRICLKQAGEAASIARDAFADGDQVQGIAAITLAAQFIQLARIWQTIECSQPPLSV